MLPNFSKKGGGIIEIFSVFGRIFLKDDGVEDKLKNVTSQAQSTGNVFDSAFKKVGSTLLKVGGTLAAGLGIHAMLENTEKAQQTMAQMNAVLKSTHDASGMTKQSLEELAEAQGKTTEFSKTQVEQGENLLLTFTKIGKSVFPDATVACENMAQSMHMDLNSACLTVGKALQDPVKGVTALQREGVKLTGSQKKMVAAMVATGNTAGAQKIILKELETEFGGSAVAAGKTFGGQMKILEHQIAGVGVGIMSKLLPPLTTLVSSINNHMPQIQNAITGVIHTITPFIQPIIKDITQIARNLFPSLGTSAKSAGSAINGGLKGALTFIKSQFDWMAQHGTAVRNVLIGIAGAFATFKTVSTVVNTINNVKKGFDNLHKACITVKSGFETVRIAGMLAGDKLKGFGSTITTGISGIGKFISGLKNSAAAEKIMSAAQAALNAIMDANPIAIIIVAIAALVTALVVLYNKNATFRNFINSMWSELKSVVGGAINAIKGFFQGLGEKIESVGTWIKNTWNSVCSFFGSLPGRFKGFMSGIGSSIVHGFDSAISFIKSLPGKALQWGKDFIQGLINGIKSMISGVENTVEAVANKIKSFLHFSTPDEGPLKDYENWMPDFMKGLAQGIEEHKGLVVNAVKGLTSDMKIDGLSNMNFGMNLNAKLTPAMAGMESYSSDMSNSSTNNSNNSSSRQPIILNFVLPSGKVLANYIIDDVNILQGKQIKILSRG